MARGKLVALVVLGFLAWQHQELIADRWNFLRSLGPMAQTYMEMRSFRTPLAEYLEDNEGRLPMNFPRWLRNNFESGGKSNAGIDYFGNPYDLIPPAADPPKIRSCGRDARCGNDDDLLVPLRTGRRLGRAEERPGGDAPAGTLALRPRPAPRR